MTTLDAAPAGLFAAAPTLLPRHARTHVDAVVSDPRPPRLLVIGPAGSGRTRLLRDLAARLADGGRAVVTADGVDDIVGADDDTVVLVDDLPRRTDAERAAVAARAARPRAALVVATAPWPIADADAATLAALESAQPPVVLGHISHADVVDACDGAGLPLAAHCIDDVLELSGHLPWLVGEALAAHDAPCTDEPGHPALREELHDLVAHRLRTADPALRDVVETLCLAPAAARSAGAGDWAAAGHAHGLLARNGRPAPIVRDAVRATTPIDRLVRLYALPDAGRDDDEVRVLLGGVHDDRLAAALVRDGDAEIARDPRRADDLFRAAAEAGGDAGRIAVRRAQAAWNARDVDRAGALLDAARLDEAHPDAEHAAVLAAAVWAARADMAMASAVHRVGAATPRALAHATIAAAGAADADELARLAGIPAARTVPSAVAVAHDLLVRGVRSTLTTTATASLGDLVRATEMYSASGTDDPIPELPAVIAATAAIATGELDLAASVLDGAAAAGHGGAWALPRLQLWQAWVAVQRERPHDAESALMRARPYVATARETVMAAAVTVALTRRYADASALAPVWRRARESVLRARFDLFSLLPLSELAVSAARTGDLATVQPHLDEAFAGLARLGSPPVWASHLHWAGVHCSIALNRPDDLVPHARALTAAAPHSRIAAVMAQAGKVWTELLTGRIDADAIERAALELAGVGLAWDGARLAGHGASRTEDRRVIGRLLACARQLHPREAIAPVDTDEVDADGPATRATDMLSAREREVAVLVVQGKTYAEIGESIFISPRTAEHHIARIRRRLGATSRSDLIAKLRLVLDEGRAR